MDCGTLSGPANGRVSTTAGTTFGQTATYSCNSGYNLVGGSTRMCQASGATVMWSGSAPTCERMLLYLLALVLVQTSINVNLLTLSTHAQRGLR